MARGTAGNKIRTITCKGCGAMVTRRMPPARRYCSQACYRSQPVRRCGRERPCEQCGVKFYAPLSRDDARFCGNDCQNVWQGRYKTEHTCKTCSRTFCWSPSRTTGGNYNITYCSLPCRDADPARSARLRDMNAALQLRKTTQAERDGYALLDRLGLTYQPQTLFQGKFTPDALVPSQRLVVQFDGDYWHDRKGTSTEPRIRRRVALDKSQDAYIRACGWRVVRLWATDLAKDPEGCEQKVRQHLLQPS